MRLAIRLACAVVGFLIGWLVGVVLEPPHVEPATATESVMGADQVIDPPDGSIEVLSVEVDVIDGHMEPPWDAQYWKDVETLDDTGVPESPEMQRWAERVFEPWQPGDTKGEPVP